MRYWVYVLRTSGGTFYVGYTNDLDKRMVEHRDGKKGAKYLRMFPSFELIYTETYETKSGAMKREAEIKKLSHAKKEALMKEKVVY